MNRRMRVRSVAGQGDAVGGKRDELMSFTASSSISCKLEEPNRGGAYYLH